MHRTDAHLSPYIRNGCGVKTSTWHAAKTSEMLSPQAQGQVLKTSQAHLNGKQYILLNDTTTDLRVISEMTKTMLFT